MNGVSYKGLLSFLFITGCSLVYSQTKPTEPKSDLIWQADLGNGSYKNPVLYMDFSDPDVVRVGDDFYMTASSFNCIPGLPLLHSNDLVNWTLVGYALHEQTPSDFFDTPQPGKGVWAPSIRYHNNEFHIYYGDPDFGVYMLKSTRIEGPWSEPVLIKKAKGWIDPCPLWDDDGNAYLVHAFAGSRAGFKSILVVNRMNAEGTQILDDGVLVFDGHEKHPTVEGPKFYKRNGYYYIFTPAGGVTTGWQLVLRSKNIYGPYEERIVLKQGGTPVNGPHQGGWVELSSGESWFLHFQDKEAFGRIVHLQPMKWEKDWPLMGTNPDKDGTGEPVLSYRKPNVGKTFSVQYPQTSDEFNQLLLGLQWQWQANEVAGWAFPTSQGFLRLNCMPLPGNGNNLSDVSNLLLQKFPASEFLATTRLSFFPKFDGEKTGLVLFGADYSYLSIAKRGDKFILSHVVCKDAFKKGKELVSDSVIISTNTVNLRVRVNSNAECQFYYCLDDKTYKPIGSVFLAKPGTWVGTKVGIFAVRDGFINDAGYANYDWFRIEKY